MIQRTLFFTPLVLVVGVLKPLAAQQIEPRLRCLLFLPAIFREVVGEEEVKEEEGSRLHIFQPLLSAPTSRAQHSDKERGSVIWLHAHTNTLHWYFSFPYGNDHACTIHFHTIQIYENISAFSSQDVGNKNVKGFLYTNFTTDNQHSQIISLHGFQKAILRLFNHFK